MKIKVYSTAACPWCYKVKEWLNEKKIEFEDIDVGADQEAAREMIEKSGQMGVPVVEVINDGKSEIIIGFDEEKLKKVLKLE